MSTNVFLLWRRSRRVDPDPADVAASLLKLFAPVLKARPDVVTRQNAAIGLVYLELPVRHWRRDFFQQDGAQWALAADYPLNAPRLLASDDDPAARKSPPLLALGRQIARRGASAVAELAAPYSLITGDDDANEAVLQIDGLGAAQVYEYQSGGAWAVTNRLFSLSALGISLRPVATEWAARWALDLFPMDMTGFKNTRFVGPGERISVTRKGVTRETHDVIANWIRPAAMSATDHAEAARVALIDMVRDVGGSARKWTALISGGWDSRAIASTLRAAGLEFDAQVGGHPDNPDVAVAAELARIGGMNLTFTAGSQPSANLANSENSIRQSLLWDAGGRITRKQKFFARDGKLLGGGRIKISGKHGEITRGYLSKGIDLSQSREEIESAYIAHIMHRLPNFTRLSVRASVEEIARAAFRQLDRYDTATDRALEIFYLCARSRRLASGSHSAKSGIVFTPFLAPEFIRAAFAYPVRELFANPVHSHIIAVNAPEWRDVPFASDPAGVAALRKSGAAAAAPAPEDDAAWRAPADGKNYDNRAYWRTEGHPLVERGLEQDGFWTKLFDQDRARRLWADNPDALVITTLLPEVIRDAGAAP